MTSTEPSASFNLNSCSSNELETARVKTLPDETFYIPNFVSQDEEQYILQKVLYIVLWSLQFCTRTGGSINIPYIHIYSPSILYIIQLQLVDSFRPPPPLDSSIPSSSPSLANNPHKQH